MFDRQLILSRHVLISVTTYSEHLLMYSTEVGSAFSSLLPTPVTSCDMTLVLRAFEPQSLQTLLLPVFMADRYINNVQFVLHELYDLQDFLEDIVAPRAQHALGLSITHLQRTLAMLHMYKLEQITRLQRALNVYVARFGRAPFVDIHW